MEGVGRARGRATRGRATRGVPAAGGAPHSAPSPAAGPQPVAPPPQGRGSAWGPKPQAPPPVQQQQQVAAAASRPATARGKQPETTVTGGIDAASAQFRGMAISEPVPQERGARRGAMRGRTEICAPMVTKPKNMAGTKQGTSGQRIKAVSNHFRLLKTTDWSLYQYRVDFSPEEDRTQVKKGLLRIHKEVLGDVYMFDGTMLFTIRRLFPLQQDSIDLFSTRESDQSKIKITIKFTNELVMGDFQYIQLFNIILRSCIDSLEFQLVGREYFDPKAAEDLRNFKLEIWPGYVTSIQQYEWDIMMCIDVSHKVLRKDTVLDCLNECRQRYREDWQEDLRNFKLEIWPGYVTSIQQYERDIMMCIDVSHKVLRKDTVLDCLNECRQRYREDWQTRFTQAVLGAVVFTHYNNKPYRVDDVDFDSTPNSTFKKGDQDIKYVNYYRDKYQINIRELRQPLLVSRPKAKDVRGGRDQNIVLIPELCNMTGLTDEMRNNFQLMKAVADKTRIPPNDRMRSYYQFMKRMCASKEAVQKYERWNIKFADRLEEITARRLEPEKLHGGENRQYSYDDSGDWAKSMRGISQLESKGLTEWVLICPSQLNNRQGESTIDGFLGELRRAAGSLRFQLGPPVKFFVERDNPSFYHQTIEKALASKQLRLVMCIVPMNKAEIYSAIKKKCCVDRPVASQVITTKTLTHKNLLSVATKIVIQMNCKLGGAPWYVPIPFQAEGKPDPTMVIGFDVCHDTNMKGRSYGALVASLDYYFTKYYSAVSSHSFGEELSNDIAIHVTHAVIRFKELNGKLPSRILLYRDGVGDSNIPFVLNHEVEMIKAKLREVFPGVQFKLAVIVVSKRIQTRFFVNEGNPKPGTVVDDVITQPERYDFFLVSQSVRQGTVSPTSYNVIYDDTGLKAEFMQKITYKMTHLYFNCSATVRVPAQVQYAHKLAFLVGQAIHQCPSTNLNSVLYFL